MQDGTPWSGNNVRDHPSMIQNSWQDGVLGTNCPIPPNSNYTYKFQAKDQIGTYTYFPSTQLHKAAGGFRALNVYHRSVIPIPYPNPDGDFTLLVGDWYKTNHKNLYDSLDVHVGQSVAVLVTLNQPPKDYYIIASTRFTEKPLTTTVVLHYANSISSVFGPVPAPPVDKYDFDWSMKQARTYRENNEMRQVQYLEEDVENEMQAYIKPP
ncbi:L-ascorbate oxidase [Glycine max]|nr:L-ascorbate oxidase [Glycine max]